MKPTSSLFSLIALIALAVVLLLAAPWARAADSGSGGGSGTGTGNPDAYQWDVAKNFRAGDTATPTLMPMTAANADTGLDARDRAYVDHVNNQTSVYFQVMLIVSFVAMVFLAFLLYLVHGGTHGLADLSGRDIMRAAVVTFVAYGAIVMALTMQNTETLTGVTGLLSAIVGYVFGRAGGDDRERLALVAGSRGGETHEASPAAGAQHAPLGAA
ncbi:MAG TPA: hypothetical protein VGM81_14500 [Burkholderiaceae bacterium]|jgi:4-amino-4-deoxy-L-arabinose transferase-like glycosyltransferase